MHKLVRQGELYLNGIAVGTILCEGTTDSWVFGKFVPGKQFGPFAPLFGAWSLLVHEDNGQDQAPPEAL